MPRGQEQREQGAVERTEEGLHENQAGSEEMPPCRRSTRIFTWENVPKVLDPALSHSRDV